MSEELVYKMLVTKKDKTETWWLCLPENMIEDSVLEQYAWGADAVELELMPMVENSQNIPSAYRNED